MLTPAQAGRLKDAGLDYYNHNLDTSARVLRRGHHDAHATTTASTTLAARARRRHPRLLRRHPSAWARRDGDRVGFLHTLATLDPHPESVPINNLVQVEGTPLAGTPAPSIRSTSCAPSRSRAS